MTNSLDLALQLLLIGMTTVFIILGIVMGIGKLLITLVNKYSPDLPANKPNRRSTATSRKSDIPEEHIAVLATVVDLISQNKGILKNIKKLS